jgi:hypothetical protein
MLTDVRLVVGTIAARLRTRVVSVDKLFDSFVFTNVMIVPEMLSKMILTFEAVLSLVFLAPSAREPSSVVLMGALMPLECIQTRIRLFTRTMLANE